MLSQLESTKEEKKKKRKKAVPRVAAALGRQLKMDLPTPADLSALLITTLPEEETILAMLSSPTFGSGFLDSPSPAYKI